MRLIQGNCEKIDDPSDRVYLEGVLNAYVDVSIQRIAHFGIPNYQYRLSGMELRAATGRQRLHEAIINDVVSFFRNANAEASYDAQQDSFDIQINLNNCILNSSQSETLSRAMIVSRMADNLGSVYDG
jgi:hypothetical protein